MRIGLAQMDIEWEDVYKNMNKIEEFVEKASAMEIELLLFPELTLTGFTMALNNHNFSQEEVLKWIGKIAARYGINVGMGFGTRQHEMGLNKYAFISKTGETLGVYSKIHPFSVGGEDKKYDKGNEIIRASIEGMNVTPFICYDLRFPEIFQIASKKSELIVVAANWPKEREDHWITLLKARAIENQCYIAGVNRVGTGGKLKYHGASMLIDPNGAVLNDLKNEEAIIVCEISAEKVKEIRKNFNLKHDRRESLYRIF